MTYTGNISLLKPSSDDFYSIDDFNENADIIDEELAARSQTVVIRTRTRDSSKPTYSIDGSVSVTLLTADYTGDSEVSVILDDTEYDTENVTTDSSKSGNNIVITAN